MPLTTDGGRRAGDGPYDGNRHERRPARQPARTTTNPHDTMQEAPMAAIRTAEVTWNGSLVEGKGTIDDVTSGAFAGLPVTWASRTETADGRPAPRSSSPQPMPRATRWRSRAAWGAMARRPRRCRSRRRSASRSWRPAGASSRRRSPSAAWFPGWTPRRSATGRCCQGRLPDQPGPEGQRGALGGGHARGLTPGRGRGALAVAARNGPDISVPRLARVKRAGASAARSD